MINIKDNLSRTCFHYACLINDQTAVEILEKGNARQVRDLLDLVRVLIDGWFR